MISLVWTRSPLPASRLIRYFTGEYVSHFAIVMDERIVFHSNFYGAHLDWYSKFLKHAEVIFQINLTLTLELEEALYLEMVEKFDGEPYDWGALLFLWYSLIRLKLFGIPIPRKNPLSSDRANICVELAECLEVIGIELPPLDTVLPERLYYLVKEQFNGHLPES